MKQIVKNAEELFYEPIPLQQHRIDNFLTNGLTLLCGAPKSRKSWMVLDLGLRVAGGRPFFGRETRPCGVLYYALEDTFGRLTGRLHQLLDEDPPENLRIATECPPLGYGFEENLTKKLCQYPDTGLVIVDTLQKIRSGENSNANAYGLDYHECSRIKKLADQKDISILVVHHTKKLPDPSDPLNMVSGTNGIAGSADTIMILFPEKRFGTSASLYIVGRDLPQQEMVLQRGKILWELQEVKDEEQLRREQIPDFIFRVRDYLSARLKDAPEGKWEGTMTSLLTDMGESETRPSEAGKYLSSYANEVLSPAGILYQTKRTRSQRKTIFTRASARESDGTETDRSTADFPRTSAHEDDSTETGRSTADFPRAAGLEDNGPETTNCGTTDPFYADPCHADPNRIDVGSDGRDDRDECDKSDRENRDEDLPSPPSRPSHPEKAPAEKEKPAARESRPSHSEEAPAEKENSVPREQGGEMPV